MSPPSQQRTRRPLLAAAALGVAGLLMDGAFAAFSATESRTAKLQAGTLNVNMPDGDLLAVNGLAPGDTITRQVTIETVGDANLASSIEIAFPDDMGAGFVDVPSETTDANGVTVQHSLWSGDVITVGVRNCNQPWGPDGVGGYACPGIETVLTGPVTIDHTVTNGAFSFNAAALGVTPSVDGTIPDGTRLHALVDMKFDPAAGSEYMGASLWVPMQVTATQRAGQAR